MGHQCRLVHARRHQWGPWMWLLPGGVWGSRLCVGDSSSLTRATAVQRKKRSSWEITDGAGGTKRAEQGKR